MKVTVLGATGGVGRQVVEQALAGGHDVRAVVRDPAPLPDDVPYVLADLATADSIALEAATVGADAVLSCLGRRSKADAGVASRGVGVAVDAMWATGVRRIIAVSASPVATITSSSRPQPPRHDPGDGLLMRTVLTPTIKRVFGDHYRDLALMEDALYESRFDWTVVRPPRMTNKPLGPAYRTSTEHNLLGGRSVSRAAVAELMLACLEDDETIGKVVRVAF